MEDVAVKLFLATLPPPDIGARIDGLGDVVIPARRLKGRRIARERLHSTLAPFREQPFSLGEMVGRAKAAATRVRARPFSVRFEWTQSFRHGGSRHPFVLSGGDGLAPLRAFQRQLADTLYQTGIDVEFDATPHVTLVWADACVEEAPIAPLEWTVRDFTLIASLQGQSRYISLASWRLG
jgi:RNA 2',3'-cyclic 3'-phosphodiesterase